MNLTFEMLKAYFEIFMVFVTENCMFYVVIVKLQNLIKLN